MGKCTRYLGSGVTGDFVWMVAYPEMKLQYVRTIWVRIVLGCGRDVWVRMSHETLGGYMFTREETMVRTCYMGSDIDEDFGRSFYRRDETKREAFGEWMYAQPWDLMRH